MYAYRLYGFVVESSIDLGLPLSRDGGQVPAHCRVLETANRLFYHPAGRTSGRSSRSPEATASEKICARFEDAVDLCIAGDELLLHRLSPDVPEDIPRIYTLGPALSVWLECKGIPALHGCCVEVAGNGVAFLSDSGGGKSNIALAALLAGEALMSDDIVAVEAGPTTVVRPSFPQMRLWPEDIPAGWGRAEDYPVVHPELSKRRLVIGEGARGRYQPDSRPLACIYLPVRSTTTDTCTFDGLGPSDAIMELVRCSFSPDFVDVAGLAPQRLSRLAQIVSTVPVRRLEYPPGRERLPAVWEAIMSDYRAIAG